VGTALAEDERAELQRLRKENKELRMEKEVLKKACVLRERNEVKFAFIKGESADFPVRKL
jgi:transposase-like protein